MEEAAGTPTDTQKMQISVFNLSLKISTSALE